MARWEAAFDAQMDVFKLWNSREGRAYAEGYAGVIRDRADEFTGISVDATGYERWRAHTSLANFSNLLSHSGGGDPVEGLVNIEKSKAFMADPIYVDDEMLDLVQAAAETFTPEPLLASDLITPAGFLLLPRALTFRDRAGKRASFRAIAWMPARMGNLQGISISLYSHKDDITNPELDDWASEYDRAQMTKLSPWGMMHVTGWMFEQPVPTYYSAEQGWWRDVQCLFRLSMQYIATRERQYPPRSTRKRAARQGYAEDRYVTVITLRRPRSKREGEPHAVEWSMRWVVDGHWRMQWYPSLNQHRQIWIAPYVKGPEDKELHIRKLRTFEFVR